MDVRTSERPWTLTQRSARWAIVIAALITLARVVYLRWLCDYNLVEDEAHYWMWSKALDWSYYSKGPGVAWAIALSTRIFGDAEWAVRLPTALLSGLGLLFVALLARDVAVHAGERTSAATPRRVAVMSVLAMVLAPALQMVGILMTIDGGYVACWAGACWCAWRAMMLRSRWAWLGLGVFIAIGFLSKYTMLLLLPGLVLFVWWNRRDKSRQNLRMCDGWRAWASVAVVLALAGLVPVIIWNAQHEWVTVRHLMGHLGLRGGDVPTHAVRGAAPASEWSPWWSLELIGQQVGMVGPLVLLGALAGWRILRPRNDAIGARTPGHLFLLACALPILAFYLIVSFITEPEGNWPMAGYVTLLPLGAWWAGDALTRRKERRASGQRVGRDEGWPRWLWRGGLWYGLAAMLMLHFAGDISASLNRLSRQAWFANTFERIVGRPPREIVVGRLYGAREMAEQVLQLLPSLTTDDGRPPFILAQHYGRASQMAYYQPHAQRSIRFSVFSAMKETGGRRSQFDLWPETSLSRPDLLGRSAIILSNNRPETLAVWHAMFDRVEPAPVPGGKLAGEHKADRMAFIGHGYRGTAGLADGAPMESASSKQSSGGGGR